MRAGSQGTRNTVLRGFPGGAIYETVGGGAGAGPGFAGRSAAQVHMTNTRATDVEVLEHRAPIRLLRVGRRWGSGGPGRWPGGDGIVREWLFLAPMEVSLLVERRRGGAPGAQGGDPGAPGEDLWITADGARPAPPTFSASPGDRLRVSTPGGGGWGRSQGG
ncbi:MAG: hydantoinase B/oxoprolinase family protein [bacterium]